MNIAVNLLFLDKNYVGGISQFTRGLVKGLSTSIPQGATMTIFCTQSSSFAVEDIITSDKIKIITVRNSTTEAENHKSSRIPYQIKYRLPLKMISSVKYRDLNRTLNEFDLVYVPHGPTAIFPFPNVPTVYSIHDIQHEYYPHFFTKEQLLGRKKTFKMCADHAASLQASSTLMKLNFLETFPNLTPDKVFLAFEGVNTEFWKVRESRKSIQGFPLEQGTRYIFLPAQLWMHKNHVTILRALKKLRTEGLDIHLIMTGARFDSSQPIFDLVEELQIQDLVHYLGIVPREDLRWLYQHADAVISAALYESSSLPILEAAANNVAIIAGDTAPNIEMAQSVSMELVPNLDSNSWALAIRQNYLDSMNSMDHSQSLKNYDWDEISKIYWQAFSRLAK